MSDRHAAADAVAASAGLIRAALAAAGRAPPTVALLLGSGWAPVADRLTDALRFPYAELPAFPHLGVDGHRGCLLVGRLAGRDVVVLSGRKHAYEDGDAGAMKGAIRALAALGVTTLLQTHAAGSLTTAMRPGELMLVTDHLNLPQCSPLFGEAGPGRFVDLRDAYDPALLGAARRAAAATGTTLHEGVYAWTMGPQFETPAEVRMLVLLGAHAVGMSTVPETILARHAGLRVLALSLLTNLGCGLGPGALSHARTLAAAEAGLAPALRLIEAIVGAMQT